MLSSVACVRALSRRDSGREEREVLWVRKGLESRGGRADDGAGSRGGRGSRGARVASTYKTANALFFRGVNWGVRPGGAGWVGAPV